MSAVAENFRSTCGSERGAPECSTQRFPAATPHVGHGTEDNCLGVSSFFLIRTECDNTQPLNCSILNTVGIRRSSINPCQVNCEASHWALPPDLGVSFSAHAFSSACTGSSRVNSAPARFRHG